LVKNEHRSVDQPLIWRLVKILASTKSSVASILVLSLTRDTHVNIFRGKTRLKRVCFACETQRTRRVSSETSIASRRDWFRTRLDALSINASRRDKCFTGDAARNQLIASERNSRNASGRVQNEILINWKININPSQIRTELPSTLSLDGLGLPWQMDRILP
jgi:hypothetical protein